LKQDDVTISDEDLVARALDGDAAAFGTLMRRYQGAVHRLVQGIVRNRTDADDLTQETFFRAYRYLGGFDPGRPLSPWLLRIAANLAFTHLRRQRRGAWLSLDAEHPRTGRTVLDSVNAPGAEAAVERPARHRELEAALDALPPLYRSILVLSAVHEMRYDEIASILGIPIGTVMSRLSRARTAMRRQMEGGAAKAVMPGPSRLLPPERSA